MRSAALILMVGLLGTEAAANRFQRVNSRCSGGRSSRGLSCENLALIEIAPASGAGMTAPCACANPTGARGEALTVTRASSGFCSKQGAANTGINNGDLVSCGNDLVRVEPSNGVSGIRTEITSTNLLLRASEVDNAVWTKEQDAAPRTPTVTADHAAAPDTTATADRVQFPATTGVQYSDYYQAATISTAVGWSCSVYVRGVSTSGTLDICGQNATGGWVCSDCAFVSGSWSRCSQRRTVTSGATSFCKVGNNSLQNGGVARSANDVWVWGHQGEEKGFATSPIITTSATAARAADAVQMTITDRADTTFCFAATLEPLWASTSEGIAGSVMGSVGFSSPASSISFSTTSVPRTVSGAVVPTTTFTAGVQRMRGYDNATNTVIIYGPNSASLASPAPADKWGATFRLTGTATFNAIVSLVQGDPDPTRCQ